MSKDIDMTHPVSVTQVVVEVPVPSKGDIMYLTGGNATKERIHTATHWKIKKYGDKRHGKKMQMLYFNLIIYDGVQEVARYGGGQWRNVWIRETIE